VTVALEPVYTAAEVATIERLHPSTVSQACKAGQFPGAYQTGQVGGEWRIPESAVVAYRESKTQRPAPAGGIEPYSPRARSRKRRAA